VSTQALNVVFVDDEQKILDGLRRQLRAHRQEWEMRFANSGEEALKLMAQQPADIVVSDMRMPGMTGAELLTRVQDIYPQTTRIIFSGQTDPSDVLSAIGCIHQYVQKPCDGNVLCDSIERTRLLARQLSQSSLRLAVSRLKALPPASETYHALVDELSKENANLPRISDLIASDPAMTAKVMQLVNSAFFGMPRRVDSPRDAVVLLGLTTIHSIVVAGRLFDFVSQGASQQSAISGLWQASVKIGESAARLARQSGASEKVASQARLCGLLSLIGRVVLLTSTAQLFEQVIARVGSNSSSYTEAEDVIYGATQDEVTAYALGLWGFTDQIVEAVALQSHPTLLPAGKKNDLLACVHLARAIHVSTVAEMDAGVSLDADFLCNRGLSDLIPEQMRIAA
jgi:HD-like signal output (HDOD) protein